MSFLGAAIAFAGMLMGKRIIVLSDGTGNAAAKVWRTNVWRIFESLDLKTSDQIAIYDDGVGTSSFKPMALLGGAFGFGLKRNVIGLYKFLCRNYKSRAEYLTLPQAPPDDYDLPQSAAATEDPKDDEIFLFGFSRGAFTVRVLAGLVLSQGLVKYGSEAELDEKAHAAFRAYRTDRYRRITLLEYPIRLMRNLFATYKHDPKQRPVERIRFIGVWDTVAAYGAPIDEITLAFSKYIWPLELPNHTLSERVEHACQALAIDEERQTFAPVLWDEPPLSDKQTLKQVWFAGVHANVGGGYPDDSLAKVSLTWMMAEAAACDLRFKTAPAADPDSFKYVDAAQDKDGRLYDPRSGIGGYYRYGPRRITLYYPKPNHGTASTPKIHESALSRIKIGAHLYAPIGLPPTYDIVQAGTGKTLPLDGTSFETATNAANRHAQQEGVWNIVWRRRVIYFLTVFASLYLFLYPLIRDNYAFQEKVTRLRIVSDTIRLLDAFVPTGAARWLDGYARDPAWFLIWVGVVAFLIWYASTLKSGINSRMRHIWESFIPGTPPRPSPSPAGRIWQAAWWLFIAILVYIGIYPLFDWLPLFSFLKVGDPLNSLIGVYTEQPARIVIWAFLIAHFIPERTIEWLRTLPAYQSGLSCLKNRIAPFFFAVIIVYLGLALSAHLLFNVRDSFGSFCKHTANARGPLNAGNIGFDCSSGKCRKVIDLYDSSTTGAESLCLPTGVFAVRNQSYAIGVHREPAKELWTFWNEPSFMGEQPISRLSWWKQPIMIALYPLRRVWDRPWGAFIVRYGPTGNEESFLDREPPPLDDDLVDPPGYVVDDIPKDHESLGETWRAKRDGEIYVYLNKPVLGIPGIETWLSKFIPMSGKARIVIEQR
jgi:uncharacterized protein (DUF2235 family)